MRSYLFLFFLVCSAAKANSQTLKPAVLVVGNSNAAVAAAIQSAQSNVKTILLLKAGGFDIEPISSNDLHSGVQAKFLEKVRSFQKVNDSVAKVSFDKQTANTVLTRWTDSVKNLTVIRNTLWVKADRSGKGWVFKLSDGRTIRPGVLVNIADQNLNAALKITPPLKQSWTEINYLNPIYKTSIAAGKSQSDTTNQFFSMYDLLLPEEENFVYVTAGSDMLLGQSAGAVAAYAGFFHLKTSESNLKKIQGELISFGANLMPFADVRIKDKNWKAVQMVGVTGVIKAQHSNGKLFFNPEAIITTAEIRQPMKDHYYKAQIWFDDYKKETLTVGAALEMISYVGNKAPMTIIAEVKKNWNASYGFSSDFSLAQDITRRELATLLQEYMPPFNITLDKRGNILR